MNPYDFVKIDWKQGVPRRPARFHDHFEDLAGRLEGTITALTPVFLPETDRLKANRASCRPFLTNRQGKAIIPGSSLKGLIRGLVETIGPGCWWLLGNAHKSGLPREFQQCPQEDGLCIACRMFGLIQGGTLLLGHVGFEDAECAEPVPYSPIYTPILDAPKPRHHAWYFAGANRLAGRKFYFHSMQVRSSRELKRSKSGVQLNQYIAPLGAGSTFTFKAYFDNLSQDELDLLIYALVLEPEMRHKLGYAKPAGLGSVEIALNRLEIVDYRKRYTSPGGRGADVYEGAALTSFVSGCTASYVHNTTSVTLADLRRIWAWPPAAGVEYGYPTRAWFDANPTAPISATLDAPCQ